MHIVACIPAYNVEDSISNIVKDSLSYVDEVIVCDDGSTDATSERASKSGALILKHSKNKGKGSALKTLFEKIKTINADFIVTIDGDGQFLPNEIPKLLKKIQDENADVVIGYRFDTETDMPKYRKIGNKLFDKMTNLSIDMPIRDTQSGFRIYSKKAIDTINFSTNGFGADSEIIINAVKQGLKITEEKVTVIYNTGGKTSSKNPISHSTDIFGSLIEHVAIRHPLKFIGIPGMVLFIIGVIYTVVVISIFNDTRYFSIPSTMVALGSLLLGLMLLLMSVVLFAIQRAIMKR